MSGRNESKGFPDFLSGCRKQNRILYFTFYNPFCQLVKVDSPVVSAEKDRFHFVPQFINGGDGGFSYSCQGIVVKSDSFEHSDQFQTMRQTWKVFYRFFNFSFW